MALQGKTALVTGATGGIHASKPVKDRIDSMTTKAAIVGLKRAVALECAATSVT
jgi:NAD(P)-dependent dehydrogenase (short-subunit alcohol dehydrogenase family)